MPRWSSEMRTAIVVGQPGALTSLGVPVADPPGRGTAEAYHRRAVYAGEPARIRPTANDDIEIHPLVPKQMHRRLAFAIPPAANTDGKLTLTWTQEPGRGGAGRGCQVAEVWLVKGRVK